MTTGQPLHELPTPAFTVDLDVVKRNVQQMSDRFRALGVQLRPHMKTHKTLEGGEIMTGGARRCIVVSTMAEARFYAAAGFDDILYAYPLPFDKVEECAALAEKMEAFHVLVDNAEALQQLRQRRLQSGRRWLVWLKVDCENGRAGVKHSDSRALELAKAIAQHEATQLAGVYAHCGNTYHCHGEQEVQAVAQATTTAILQFADTLRKAGVECPRTSIGSTPSCSLPVPDMGKLTEVHPGNYVFYDVQQMLIGSCKMEDIAVRVLTRVIGHYPHRNQLLVDCGWTGLSLHSLEKMASGYAVIEGHLDLKFVDMTQEHGRIEPRSGKLDFSKFPLGSLLSLIPYHSCATAAMHPVYYVHSEGKILTTWAPTRGW